MTERIPTTSDEAGTVEPPGLPAPLRHLGPWGRFRKNRAALVCLAVVLLLIVVAALAPYLAPRDPFSMNFRVRSAPPSAEAPMGTDRLGRDIASRVVWGTRVSLVVGFATALIAGAIGILVGVVGGYFGGVVGNVLMRLVDLFMVLPTFFLIIIVAALFGGTMWTTILILGLTLWPPTARLVRAEVISMKEREYAVAALASGASRARIMFLHLLPNSVQPGVVNASLTVASAILLEASLSFLGLGDPSRVSWGWMLNDALGEFRTAWWTAVLPGIAISVTVVAFNLLGDGFNDSLNPKGSRT